MIGLIQRVSAASVRIVGETGEETVGSIGRGVLLLLGVQKGDDERTAARLLERVLGYRIFPDEQGRMNRSLTDVRGGLLVVSQFTLAADTRSGMRAGFSTAAVPAEGERLYDHFVDLARTTARAAGLPLATGRFGADMQVSLTNDGPVTFWLEVSPDIDKSPA